MRRATVGVAVLATACGVRPGPSAPAGQATSTSAVAAPGAAGGPSFEPGAPARATPLSQDPLWQRAARGDVIDLARLADREGAVGLLAGVELGGTLGLTALSALPHAEDGEVALGRLCELATRMPVARVAPVLVAVEGILGRPVRPTERLDAEGLLACRSGLRLIETSAELAPADRDRVGNARALLEEWLHAH